MDNTRFELFKHLNNEGNTTWVEFSDLLKQMFPIDESNIYISSKIVWDGEIRPFLLALYTEKLITLPVITDDNGNIEAFNGTDSYSLCDIKVTGGLTIAGRKAYEDELARRTNLLQTQTTIQTNRSVRKTNRITRRSQDITVLIGIISTIFIVVTGVKACNDDTESKIEAITTQMKEQKKIFDSINSNLEKLYKAVQATKLDTEKNKN